MSAPIRATSARVRWRDRAVALVVVALTAAIVPRWVCGRDAPAWMAGDEATQRALGDVVARRAARGVGPGDLQTGSDHFDGEWALVTNQMSVLGLGQIGRAHPDARAAYLPAMRAAVAQMLRPSARAFGTRAWDNEDGLAHLESEHGHAYLGYLDLALGMLRAVDPAMDPRWIALHEALTAALERRLARATYGMIETYPGVTFPADVASAIGAIGLHARATGADHRAMLAAWSRVFRARCIDPRSGFVYQTMDPRTGRATSTARGSGTALVVYFVAFADPALARDLDAAVGRDGWRSFVGFGGVREYATEGARGGAGDIDSGPVVFGVSVAATGFGLAGARMFGDAPRFAGLYRTADLFGAPTGGARGGRGYLAGSGLGDAILLAMMTARVEP